MKRTYHWRYIWLRARSHEKSNSGKILTLTVDQTFWRCCSEQKCVDLEMEGDVVLCEPLSWIAREHG